MTRVNSSFRVTAALFVAAATLVLAGCSSGEGALGQAGSNYASGDGTISEFAIDTRGEKINFSGITEAGENLSAEQFRVTVVNFWYAACPPCRLEAPWLEELWQQFETENVQFVGVNVRDSTATAQTFAREFGITYPSIVDTDGAAALGFAGVASPTAVPTTVVLDRQGRPASRIVGLIDKSILEELIASALEEPSDGGGG